LSAIALSSFDAVDRFALQEYKKEDAVSAPCCWVAVIRCSIALCGVSLKLETGAVNAAELGVKRFRASGRRLLMCD